VPASSQTLRTQRVALVGLAVNLALAVLKLLAGIVGHCYALIADAIESIADIVGSVVILGGLRVGARPADDDHPYGHGKAEALAALVVAILVGLAGVGILIKAIDEILTPHHTPAWWTLVVLVAVVIIKESMSRYAARVARQEGNTAMAVEAGHHRADVITSAAAFIGISIAVAGERNVFGHHPSFNWASADDYAAVFASFVIMYNAWRLARLPLHELMDAIPVEAIETARNATLTVPGVKGIEKCRGRTSGSRHYIEIHAEVAPEMTVADAHIITGKIKTAVRAALPTVADIHIHVEPHEPAPAPAVPPTPPQPGH
jgi:cation diffusion facilitator family transporter